MLTQLTVTEVNTTEATCCPQLVLAFVTFTSNFTLQFPADTLPRGFSVNSFDKLLVYFRTFARLLIYHCYICVNILYELLYQLRIVTQE